MFDYEVAFASEMKMEDAVDIVGNLSDFLAPERHLGQELRDEIILAGRILADQVHELSVKLAEAEARSATFTGGSIPGDHLVRGEDAGGPRHFLAGRPLRAGTALRLLTRHGWMEGRYEWSFGDRPARLYHELPSGQNLEIGLPPNARLAWPQEWESDT